ncbi:hypothetical protein HY251_01550, partial [bacterium]|nr:hypothetical protein [bacterium]
DLAREVDDEAETLRSFFRRGRPQAFAAESQKHRRLARLEAALRATNDARRTAEDLEDLGIAILLERDHDSAPAVAADVGSLARAIDAAVFRLRATRFEPADAVLLLVAPLPREKSIVRELASSYLRFAVSHRFEIAAWAETRKTKHPGKPLVPAFASVETPPILAGLEEDAEPVARWTGAFVFVVSGENAVACFAGEDGRHRHVPAKDNLPDRHALVRAVPIPPPRELGEQGLARALAKLHTVKIEGEDAPRGVPAALPEVARVYRDRGRVPEITDPRTGRAVNDARLADAWRFQDELASAFLERLEGEPSREAALA